jgi:hypothetical protein
VLAGPGGSPDDFGSAQGPPDRARWGSRSLPREMGRLGESLAVERVCRSCVLVMSRTPAERSGRERRLSAVLLDEQACHRLGSLGGLYIALGCDDDRALNEDVPRARERIGVAQAGFLG